MLFLIEFRAIRGAVFRSKKPRFCHILRKARAGLIGCGLSSLVVLLIGCTVTGLLSSARPGKGCAAAPSAVRAALV